MCDHMVNYMEADAYLIKYYKGGVEMNFKNDDIYICNRDRGGDLPAIEKMKWIAKKKCKFMQRLTKDTRYTFKIFKSVYFMKNDYDDFIEVKE